MDSEQTHLLTSELFGRQQASHVEYEPSSCLGNDALHQTHHLMCRRDHCLSTPRHTAQILLCVAMIHTRKADPKHRFQQKGLCPLWQLHRYRRSMGWVSGWTGDHRQLPYDYLIACTGVRAAVRPRSHCLAALLKLRFVMPKAQSEMAQDTKDYSQSVSG